jgi:hypothetical protein
MPYEKGGQALASLTEAELDLLAVGWASPTIVFVAITHASYITSSTKQTSGSNDELKMRGTTNYANGRE